MPGYIIQGVRGEGKSLAAVKLARDYLRRRCPVATNLDLFLDNLVDSDNDTPAYRLPDHPRVDDLKLLPSPASKDYKSEDKNGLLILDELATWINSREWSDKSRLPIIKWLLLSRKLHWDLVLLVQDHEMIDTQIKRSLCDYIVQASRKDREKWPIVAPLLEFLYFDAHKPQMHVYDVWKKDFSQIVETWRFDGKDLYDCYDTNQFFDDGHEEVNGKLVDMRATFTYLPANYLSKQIYIDRLNKEIQRIQQIKSSQTLDKNEEDEMPPKKQKNEMPKIIVLSLVGLVFIGYRLFNQPEEKKQTEITQAITTKTQKEQSNEITQSVSINPVISSNSLFIQKLFNDYKPRLSILVYHPDKGSTGLIEFYKETQLVERFTLAQLRSFGLTFEPKAYGIDVITSDSVYRVTSWPRPYQYDPSITDDSQNENG